MLRNRSLAEEAGERAVHELLLNCLRGRAPASPVAWVTVVARRLAAHLSRTGRARTGSLDDQLPSRTPPDAAWRQSFDAVLPRLYEHLTPRQQQVVAAAISNRTCQGAARSCGMSAHDFRRHIAAIGRRAQRVIAALPELEAMRNGL